MKTKIICSFIYLSALATPARADYLEADYIKPKNASDITSISPFGVSALGSGPVDIATKGRATTSINDRYFVPSKVNDAGSVVGITFGVPDTDNDFAFFTALGGTSQLLLTSPNISAVALNSDNKSAVIEKTKVSFFNAPVGSAAPVLATTVNAGAGQEFVEGGDNIFLPNGDLIAAITELGTPRYARITPTGVITVYQPSVLPPEASLFQTGLNGKIVIFNQGSPASVDFSNAPVKLLKRANQVGADVNGNVIVSDYSSSSKTSGFPIVYDAYLGKKSAPNKLECFFPQSEKISDFDLYYITKGGIMIGKSWGGKHSGDLTYLTPTSEPAVSFCPQLNIKIVGECKRNITSTDGVYFSGTVKKNTRCEVEVTVKDQAGKPLANKTVVSDSGRLKRGKTNKNGKLRFKFLVNGPSYINLEGPFNDKKYYSTSATISASN